MLTPPKTATSRLRRARDARLRWLATLVVRDPDTLRPGDWLNLADELRWFFAVEVALPQGLPLQWCPTPASLPAFGTPEGLRPLQARLRQVFIDQDVWTTEVPLTHVTLRCTAPGPAVVAQGTVWDLLVLRLCLLLPQAPYTAFRRCAVCGQWFYPNRNQDSCSRTCTNIVSQRHYRARHSGRKPRLRDSAP